MGFVCSNFAKIPTQGFDWYLFILEGGWRDQLHNELYDNFDHLSQEVGSDVLVVRGVEPREFPSEVYRHYALYLRSVDFINVLPCLMVTNQPPLEVGQDVNKLEKAVIILFPLGRHIQPEGLVVPLLRDLSRSLRDPDAFYALEELNRPKIIEKWGWVNKYFEIKPNFFGLGVDLNAIFEDLMGQRK